MIDQTAEIALESAFARKTIAHDFPV